MTDPVLHRLPLADWWQNAPRIFGFIPVLAWHWPGIVYVLHGFASRKRIEHECHHEVLGGNEIHHPWWHFCILVRHPFRRHVHCNGAAARMAHRLLSTRAIGA